ncbi:calpain-D-like [Ylistrum balloti]|uniref:calpain-D-like n=1 Tax=Ylistrum balloti TaxID=509963 RepID=UPI002905BA7C|nr:calpain-D-like [Ylistrum balloti]
MSGSAHCREVEWICKHCTLKNKTFRKRCAACYQQRIHTDVSITENGRTVNGWTCTHCQHDNTVNDQSCIMCSKKNTPRARLVYQEEEFKVESWQCNSCTYLNPEILHMCEVCENPRDWTAENIGNAEGITASDKGKRKDRNDKKLFDKEKDGKMKIGKDKGKDDKITIGKEKDKISKGPSNDISSKQNDKDSPRQNPHKKDRKRIEILDHGEKWRCKTCTFLNSQLMTEKCEMCDSVRPSSIAQAQSLSRSAKRQRLQQQKSMCVVDLEKREEREAMKRWISITTYCREKKIKFIDADFPHNMTSLFSKPKQDGSNPQWRRCHDISTDTPVEKWVVYRENPIPDDIQQGYLGNCWYLSALAVLADRKELLEKIILTKTFCQEGAYHLRLCKDGYWKIVLVDDVFPCDSSNRLLYSRGKRKQLWVPLIEKAAAKLFGCYEALTSGHTVEALSLLTGEPCEHISFKETAEGDKETDKVIVWSKLVNARESKFLMGTSCCPQKDVDEGHYKKMGLVCYHAYSLLDVQDIQGNQLVRLRNPWGRESWNGDWSDTSQKWSTVSASSKTSLNPTENKKGVFWMCLEEYMKYFGGVDICKVRSDWHELRIKGVFPPNAGKPWKFVNLSLLERTQLDIGLFQKSHRGQEGPETTLDLLIVIMENDMVGSKVFKRVVKTSQRCQRSFVGCEVDLNPGYYTIACLAFKHWQTADHSGHSLIDEELLDRDFVMSLHSSQMILSEEIDSGIPLYRTALADILIQTAIQKGTRKEHGQDGLATYELWWHGAIFVLENTSSKLFGSLKCDVSKSTYITSTRGAFVTIDCLPPRHRQVTTVLTPQDARIASNTSWLFTYSMSTKPDLEKQFGCPKGIRHVPDITRQLEALHSPRPIV